MKHVWRFVSVLALISMSSLVFADDDTESAKRKAVGLVDRGLAYMKKLGSEKAFKDFTAKEGGFIDGSYYLFVVDFKGKTLAHGGNPALVGQSMFDLKDADGKFFIREFIEAARARGWAWIDYKWSNPTTKKIERKSTYVKKIEGTESFIGCGIYLK